MLASSEEVPEPSLGYQLVQHVRVEIEDAVVGSMLPLVEVEEWLVDVLRCWVR
jgi:hypothetical protein